MLRKWIPILVLCFAACQGGSDTPPDPSPTVTPVPRPLADAIAKAIPSEAATVKQIYQGKVGAPVVVIEENHGSRTGQLETALVLSRLHDRFALKHVILEGFLKGDESFERVQSLATLSPVERARSAARLVGEGEIGGAEFAALVYDDISVHPAETAEEYSAEQRIDGPFVIRVYLGQIALYSLDQEGSSKAQKFAENLQKKTPEGANPEEQKFLNAVRITEYVISLDPWAKDLFARYQDETKKGRSIEDEISLIQEIVQRGEEKQAAVTPDLKSKLDDYLNFLKKRAAASETIVGTTAGIADEADVPIVATNIGAGHTDRVCALLKQAGRPFVLVSLNSLNAKDDHGYMSFQELDRKYKMEPVTGGVLRDALLEVFPTRPAKTTELSPGNNKPRPVVQQEWFQAKAELYASTQDIAGLLRGGDGGGGQPPIVPPLPSGAGPSDGGDGWRQIVWTPNDERRKVLLNNQFVHVDPDSIEVRVRHGKPVEVLFQAVLANGDQKKPVWVKAGLVEHLNPDESPKTVEDVLKVELKKEKEPDAKKESAEKGEDVKENIARVQISLDTKAIFASTREEAIKAQVQY